MNKILLDKHIKNYIENLKKKKEEAIRHLQERKDHMEFYQSFDKRRIQSMSEDDFYQYISKLWAMLIWGNK